MPPTPEPPAPGFSLWLNGEKRWVLPDTPNLTVLSWLRAELLTGTKEGCAEGDCGACTVLVREHTPAGAEVWRAVNSCIALLPTLAGKEIWTVEGLAKNGLHPVQEAMACGNGTQCGFCTPGFIASLAEGYYREDLCGAGDIAEQLDGNLCRCTGYRPIREAAAQAWQNKSSRPLNDPVLASAARDAEPEFHRELPCVKGRFFQPRSLAELWDLQERYPEAETIAGGTEVGVAVAKLHRRYPDFISLQQVAEFLVMRLESGHLVLGAGVPLTDLMPLLREHAPSLHAMCRWFASRPIRNRATLGGNLATASPIGDTAPVLLSLGAELQLVSPSGRRCVPLREFFTGYRRTVLQPREWITEIRLPLPGPGLSRRAWSHKVSKRREMDISIVSAGFCLDTDPAGRIVRAGLGFGGVAPTPASLPAIEQLLVGRFLDEALSEAVADRLKEAFTPITDGRGTREYRQSLPAELWLAFARNETDAIEQADQSESWPARMPWQAEPAPPHESAHRHVSGSARYVDDDAERARALHVWPVTSPHAHATFSIRDTSAAESVPGILRVMTARDIPQHNNTGPVRHDEPLLADGKVFYVGQIVAAVVGESLEVCRAAAEKIVIDYAELPCLVSLAEAVAAESFHTDFNTIRRGEVAAELARSPVRFSGEFALGGQEHFYLEAQAAWAEITEDDLLMVHSSTQHPTEAQTLVAEMLGWDRHRVIVHSPRMGGGFGGKETQGAGPACLAALATHLTQQPCRVRYNRDQDFLITGKRHPFLARFEIGAEADGTVRALAVELFSNGGWSLDLSQAICDRALFHLDNAYYFPHVEFRGRVARTNLPSNTAFRGFGGPQGMLVIEEIIDRLARRLGLEPGDVRERNLYRATGETNTTHYGQEIGDNRIPRIWHELKESSDFVSRRQNLRKRNQTQSRFQRGLAQTAVKFGISFTHTPYNQAGALVLVYTDGSVQVNHGGTEMGQGLYSKIQVVAARSLGLPLERIRVTQTRTDKIPNTSATAASSGSDLNGAATRNACDEIKKRIEPVARELLGVQAEAELVFADGAVFPADDPSRRVTFAELVREAYNRRIALAAFGFYRTPEIYYDRQQGRGRPFFYFACGSAVSEVELDTRTGQYRVLRVDILHDVGNSLNPAVDRGQIEGGFIQGMGWLTSEELVWNERGHLLSHGASTYEIPTLGDAPADFRVELLSDAAQPGTIYGSKAVGEPPLMLAISVREALKDAIAQARRNLQNEDAGEILLASPATCEAVYRALKKLPPSADAHRRLTV